MQLSLPLLLLSLSAAVLGNTNYTVQAATIRSASLPLSGNGTYVFKNVATGGVLTFIREVGVGTNGSSVTDFRPVVNGTRALDIQVSSLSVWREQRLTAKGLERNPAPTFRPDQVRVGAVERAGQQYRRLRLGCGVVRVCGGERDNGNAGTRARQAMVVRGPRCYHPPQEGRSYEASSTTGLQRLVLSVRPSHSMRRH